MSRSHMRGEGKPESRYLSEDKVFNPPNQTTDRDEPLQKLITHPHHESKFLRKDNVFDPPDQTKDCDEPLLKLYQASSSEQIP